ncbi:MAG: hypothetical protein AABX71_01405 [Nanoarchaeota archaeon]
MAINKISKIERISIALIIMSEKSDISLSIQKTYSKHKVFLI